MVPKSQWRPGCGGKLHSTSVLRLGYSALPLTYMPPLRSHFHLSSRPADAARARSRFLFGAFLSSPWVFGRGTASLTTCQPAPALSAFHPKSRSSPANIGYTARIARGDAGWNLPMVMRTSGVGARSKFSPRGDNESSQNIRGWRTSTAWRTPASRTIAML